MKHNMNRVLSIVALLMLTLGTWAAQTVNVTVLPNQNAGTVTSSVDNEGKCTLTATPATGYYATLDNISVELIVSGNMAQAPRRSPNISDNVEVTAKNSGADPSGVTQYEFQMPTDENLGVEVTVEFQTRTTLSDANTVITLAETPMAYDGNEKEPAVTKVTVAGVDLEANEYSVSYSDNVNAGESAKVTVTGLRTYTGKASTTFTISPKSITTDMITLSPSSFVYNGKKQVPKVTVTDGDVTLVGDDYDISFELVVENEDPSVIEDENTIIDVATYNVVVNGKGNYTGSATKSFDITKAPLENLSVSLQGWTYGEQPEVISPSVSGNLEAGTQSFSYKVKNADDNTYTTEVPENAGTYTIKVVVAETDNYASGTATADFTIAKAYLTVEGVRELTVSITGWKYGATPNKPSVVGNLGNGDVTYTYKDAEDDEAEFTETVPTNVGSYIVKATVAETANYYGGEAYNEFSIEKGDIPALTVSTIDGQTYDGEEHTLISVSGAPEGTTVKYYYSEIEAADYENGSFQLMCEPSTKSFSATVPKTTNVGYFALLYRVEGGDSYTDKEAGKLIKVAIYPAEITELTLFETEFTYDILAHTPSITSVKAGNLVLTDNDYTVSYEQINGDETTTEISASEVKAVGSYNVVVTGQGNFTGTAKAPFAIVNRTLGDGEVTFHNNWATFYNAVGDVDLPEGIGAYIATQVNNNEVIVTQIKNVPQGVAVLLNNNTTTTTENTSTTGNLLRHADKNIDVYNSTNYYGLYNGKFMRVKGTIYADRNYLLVPEVVQPANAPQLTIVFEGNTTAVNGVSSKKAEVSGDFYDLQGRKVEKPLKKGLYINKGQKVVVK